MSFKYEFNPFTNRLGIYEDVASVGDSRYLKLDASNDPVTGYLRLGAGTTGHSLSASGDLLVSGKLEVDGVLYGDSALIMRDGQSINFVDGGHKLGAYSTYTQTVFSTGTYPFVFGYLWDCDSRNYDHGTATRPTIFIHSETNPNDDNTQWLSLSHNTTNGVIDVGKGNLTISADLVASNLTSSALTSGRVVFAGASGLLSDASNFLWDNSNNRLGVNRASPRKTLSVNGKVNLGSDAEDAALDPYTLAMKDNGAGVFIWRTNNTVGKEPYFLFWAQTSGAYGGQLRALRNGTNAQGFLMSDRTNSKEFMRLQDGKVIINNNGQVSAATDLLQIRQSASHSGNYLECQTSGGTPVTYIKADGSIRAGNKVIFTQTDGNEAIDSLADGYMDYLATTSHRFNAPIKIASKALLGTPVAGALEFYSGRFYITNVSHQRVIDRTSDVAVETATCANTTDETTLWTGVMDADSLVAGNMFKFHADGLVSNDGNHSDNDITIRVRVGGTEVVSLTPVTKALTDVPWHINANACQRTLGSTGSRAVHLHLAVGDVDEQRTIALATVDTTASMNVTVTAEWATAKATNTISLYQGFMEYKN